MEITNNTFQNCSDLLTPDLENLTSLGIILAFVCGYSYFFAGCIYCGRRQYASEFRKGEKHCCLHSLSILAYVFDVTSDVFLSMQYFKGGNFTYFLLTAAFSLAPIIVTYIALCALTVGNYYHLPKFYWCGLIFAAIVFGPIAAVCVHLIVSIASLGIGPDKWFPFELTPVVHSLLEINLESLPQIVLQLYININIADCDNEQIEIKIFRIVAVAASVFSVAIVLIFYKTHITNTPAASGEERQNIIKWWKKVLEFLKELFLVITRVMVMSFFVSKFTFWFYVFLVIRFVGCIALSFGKKINQNTDSTQSQEMSLIKRAVLTIIDGCMNFFIVVRFIDYDVLNKRNKKIDVAGNSLIVIENYVFYCLWFISMYKENNDLWYFWISVAIMIVYFLYWTLFICYSFWKCRKARRERTASDRLNRIINNQRRMYRLQPRNANIAVIQDHNHANQIRYIRPRRERYENYLGMDLL